MLLTCTRFWGLGVLYDVFGPGRHYYVNKTTQKVTWKHPTVTNQRGKFGQATLCIASRQHIPNMSTMYIIRCCGPGQREIGSGSWGSGDRSWTQALWGASNDAKMSHTLRLFALPFVQSVASFWTQVDDQEEMEGQFNLQALVKKVEELLPSFLRSLDRLLDDFLRSWSGARRTKGKSWRSWRNSQCLWYAVKYSFASTGTRRLSYAFVRCRCW